MTYQVRWKRTAKNQLAAIWLNAQDRKAVTQATHRIDMLLQTNPESRGEARSGSRRVLAVLPLVVAYKVQEQGLKVTVLSVRYLPPHSRGN